MKSEHIGVIESFANLYSIQNIHYSSSHADLASFIMGGMRIADSSIMEMAYNNYQLFELYTTSAEGARNVYNSNGFYMSLTSRAEPAASVIYIPLTAMGKCGQPSKLCENVCNFDLVYNASENSTVKERFEKLIRELAAMVAIRRCHG